MKVIEFRDVWEKYRTKFVLNRRSVWREIWVLKDINFSVHKGETVGIIGENGAGKTTLLKLIAGMLRPDKGEIKTQEKILTLMEIGAGFYPDLTGRENIYFNAGLYGIDRKVMDERIDEIIGFADIGKFIDSPVRCYSQGMYLRLAFGLAVHVNPDIFLIDDVLVVGDEDAQKKCLGKILELKNSGKTIILVSHEMNIINRLCDRAIFLKEGRLIQDGIPSRVVSRYLETVGQKKGIGELNEGDLRLVFNNGKLFISWKDRVLTKYLGGYFSFYHSTAHLRYVSINAVWKVVKSGRNELVAEGIYQYLPVREIWKIKLESEEQFEIEIDIKSEDSAIKEKQAGFYFNSDYKEWASLAERNQFPPFFFRHDFQHIKPDSYKGNVLALASGSLSTENVVLPSLVLELKEGNRLWELLNTGYDKECRLIQERFFEESVFSAKIRIFPETAKFENYIQNLQKQYLLKKREKERDSIPSHIISKGAVKVYADVYNKSLLIFYEDKKVTRKNGLLSLIEIPEAGKIFSFDFSWEVIKKSSNELSIVLRHQDLALIQIWTLICQERGVLDINIDIQIEKGSLFLPVQILTLQITDNYTNWKSSFEKGDFSIGRYITGGKPLIFSSNRISKICLEDRSNKSFPKLTFEFSFLEARRILDGMIDKRAEEGCIMLSSGRLILRESRKFPGGRHNFFKGKIILGREVSLNEKSTAPVYQISRGNLKAVFTAGQGRIFWGNKELTSSSGMYTSLYSSGSWFDSAHAVWRVKMTGKNKLVLEGDWAYLPISQIWQIELISENLIYWKVEMTIYRHLNLEIEQANLMLSNDYKKWIVKNQKEGEYLDEYPDSYDIYPFRFWYGKVNKEGIGVFHKELPSVVFINRETDVSFKGIIENTNSSYKARLLQYQKVSSNEQELSKKYKYFEGAIKIEPKI